MDLDYTHHVPDSVVRSILPHDKLNLYGCIPDGISQLDENKFLIFEYENSSMGLLTCVAKYQHLCSSNPNLDIKVYLIESGFHVSAHKQDTKLAKFVANYSKKNLSFVFLECDGTEKGLLKIVRRAINLSRLTHQG